ncbi:sugar diacid recognition domain-containing protein [Janthinobacterium fluminis]|uniref:Sugar diacid recognition domain-containing protein n=1 Tax=Janthinobacterium fluminis TaxID=2987524 RepID=A0ABT5JZY5_9BURK|nr:sugar diacid recognition domain-containing protein [Janthinobacterium fluminis]MDC8758281.1 sugar diacid recognition domain-containing protein [Janthinobacterium fluminis]
MYVLNSALAQDIVNRTMKIIPFNVNVMDANGTILASGDPSRIGELHAGALLALAKKLTVEVDAATAKNLHGARPGVNLPLTINGKLCGAIGLSGAPERVRQFGELVRLTAEMILEQASLSNELQRDTRYREALLLNLIKSDRGAQAGLEAWALRLGVDLRRTQMVFLLELDDGDLPTDLALAEIQRIQSSVLARQPAALTATLGPRDMLILDAYDASGVKRTDEALRERRLQGVAALLREECRHAFRLTMGIALPGIDSVAISYQSAATTARVGRQRDPQRRVLSYYELALPVLLSELGRGWQAQQLRLPMLQLQARDKNGMVLRRTLDAWFAHDGHPAATAAALHIHRNTLDYRLRRIGAVTGLDLARTEDRILLYVAALLQP